jgi:CheY-like chemotaxis protein
MRIAYVEDNATNIALMERVVKMAQHSLVTYTEGEVALEALERETYDLILMDIELAGEMNGLQLVGKLRAGGLTTPVVAVTAYAMLGDREKCLAAGCNDYLPKPLPITDVVALLAKYDGLVKAAAETPSPTPMPVPVMEVSQKHEKVDQTV